MKAGSLMIQLEDTVICMMKRGISIFTLKMQVHKKESAGLIDYLRIEGRRKPEHSNKQQPHAI